MPLKREPWILTGSGVHVTPLLLKPDQVRGKDVAHGLGNKCRFSGLIPRHYSVAQHSVLGALLLLRDTSITDAQLRTDLAAAFLLHDAGETYLPDVPSPIKPYAGWIIDGEPWRWETLENQHREVIAEALGFRHPALFGHLVVRDMDHHMVQLERGQLLPLDPDWPGGTTSRWPDIELGEWSPRRAREEWMSLACELLDQHAVMGRSK